MNRIAFEKGGESRQPWKAVSACGLSLLLLFGQTAPVLGNPSGGVVVAGSATIGSAGLTLTINQSTQNAIINWRQFSIASGEVTKFIVPTSSSATLNRVTGGNPSAIYGTLQSNGILYLVNPSGIVVGPNGRIDTAGFLASTLDVSNQQFLKGGDLNFAGASDASIDNEGTIQASSGDVYLIASQVNNNGTLSALQGSVGLAAGLDVLFQQAGNEHLFVQATPVGTARATGVTNAGTIRAAAAELRAAGGNAYALAINNTGSIAATGFKKVNGQVYLTSDGGDITNSGQISAQMANGNGGTIVMNGHGTASSGTVLNSGSLLATGKAHGKTGGTVEVLGNRVGITDQGVVDVSGDAGGGTALIGGDEHGANPAIADADQTYLGPDATITADALTLGTGGKVILWGNQTTQVYGQISATGGAQGGNGGFVETSGANLDARTAPNLSAPHGALGTWLLDPSDVTISDTVSDNGFNPSPAFTINSGTVTISQSTLLGALQTGNVTIDASAGSGGTGTISWTQSNGPVTTNINTAASTLTLDAPNLITVDNVSLSFTGGKVNVVINSSRASGPISIQDNTSLSLNGGDFTAFGTGNSSNLDGIDVMDSTIDAQGGSINLTGQSAFFNNTDQGGNVSGIGVFVNNSVLESASSSESGITGGNITILGDGSPGTGITTVTSLIGAYITHSVVSVANGALSLTGDVNSGTAQAILNEDGSSNNSSGESIGLIVDNGTVITSTGSGSVSIHGDTTSSSAELLNEGVDLSGQGPASESGPNSIVTSIISAAGGLGITITGTAGDVANSPSGINIETPGIAGIALRSGLSVLATGSAPITFTGTGGDDQNTVSTDLGNEHSVGIGLQASDNGGGGDSSNIVVSSASGAISMTGTGGNSVNSVDGISLDSSSSASASITSSAANITLNGFATNTADQTGSAGNSGDVGVDISSEASTSAISSINALAGSIAITGAVTSGVNNTEEAGVVVGKDSQIVASGTGGSAGATAQGDVSITGITTTSTSQSLNAGVFINGVGTLVRASGIVPDASGYTGLTIFGTSSTINGSTGGTVNQNNGVGGLFLEPLTSGIVIIDGAELQTVGSAPMTLNGTGGTNANTLNSGTNYTDPTTGVTSGSYGVAIGSPEAEQTTTLSSGGLLSITGQAGSSPTTGIGVMIGGPSNVGAVSVTSAGAISLIGTGGAGNAGNSGSIPNAGVAIFDPGNDSGTVVLQANGGDFNITGTAGTGNSTGVFMAPYFGPNNGTVIDPTLTASGNLNIVSTAGLVDYEFTPATAQNISVTAPIGTASTLSPVDVSGPVSLSGGDFTVDESFDAITWGTVLVKKLTIIGGATAIDLGPITATAFTFTGSGALSIDGAIQATGLVSIHDTGADITFGPAGTIIDSGSGNNVILAAGTDLASGHQIINHSAVGGNSANAIQVSGGANFDLYSSDPTLDTLGGITVPQANMVFNATYPAESLPSGNAELFYVASSGGDGGGGGGGGGGGSGGGTGGTTPPSTTTGGAAGGGSNIVPPALTPQPPPPGVTPPDAGNLGYVPPVIPVSYTGNGTSGLGGQGDGGLASSTGNTSQVGQNSTVEVGGGGVGNANNPQAAGALSVALGPVVYHNLADALKDLGDWGDVPPGPAGTAAGDDQETILGPGEYGEVDNTGVKNIPADQAPDALKHAMDSPLPH